MSSVYIMASSILGMVLLTFFADLAIFKFRKFFVSGKIFSACANATSEGENSYSNKPLTRAQVMQAFPEGTWQREAYDDFEKALLSQDPVFPCIYATKGFQSDGQLYLFIDSDDLSDSRYIRSLATALSMYLPRARGLRPNTSFVLLARKMPLQRTTEEYNTLFWELLNGLAKLDTKPWPIKVPRDIDTDWWCFCFGGELFFTAVQTPVPSGYLTFLFSTDAKRAGALAKVRTLLAKYDPIPLSSEINRYGEPGSRECKQHLLLDENVPAACPFDKLDDSVVLKT